MNPSDEQKCASWMDMAEGATEISHGNKLRSAELRLANNAWLSCLFAERFEEHGWWMVCALELTSEQPTAVQFLIVEWLPSNLEPKTVRSDGHQHRPSHPLKTLSPSRPAHTQAATPAATAECEVYTPRGFLRLCIPKTFWKEIVDEIQKGSE